MRACRRSALLRLMSAPSIRLATSTAIQIRYGPGCCVLRGCRMMSVATIRSSCSPVIRRSSAACATYPRSPPKRRLRRSARCGRAAGRAADSAAVATASPISMAREVSFIEESLRVLGDGTFSFMRTTTPEDGADVTTISVQGRNAGETLREFHVETIWDTTTPSRTRSRQRSGLTCASRDGRRPDRFAPPIQGKPATS